MEANNICPNQTASKSDLGPWEQSDLGPYCLQYRLQKMISRQEDQPIVFVFEILASFGRLAG